MTRNPVLIGRMNRDQYETNAFEWALDRYRCQIGMARAGRDWARVKARYMKLFSQKQAARRVAEAAAKDAEEEALKAQLLALMNEANNRAPEGLLFGPTFNLD